MVAAAAPIGGRSCSIPHSPRRTSFAASAPRTAKQIDSRPALPPPPRLSQPRSPARTPPTVRPIPRRTPSTSGSAHIDRNPPPPAAAAERTAPAFPVPSVRSPKCTAALLRNRVSKARPQSNAIAPRPPRQPESPARAAATRTKAQRMQRRPPARRRLSAKDGHAPDLAQYGAPFQPVRS